MTEIPQNVPLHELPPLEIVDANDPYSPLFCHLQAVDLAIHRKPFSDELVLHINQNNPNLDEHQRSGIELWNSLLMLDEMTRNDDHEGIDLSKMYFAMMVLNIAGSYGDIEDTPQHLLSIESYLEMYSDIPEDYRQLLDFEGLNNYAIQENYYNIQFLKKF
jgi:hypothetical protein